MYGSANKFSARTLCKYAKRSLSTKFALKKYKEEKIDLGGLKINYLKVGKGTHNILCLPGALGSLWTDFKPQIEGLNKDLFTIVAIDLPGYGKSRPPDRVFPIDFYEKDADTAYNLMKILNIPKFSILGWSDGGICGMILAGKYQNAIDKMIMWGANSIILPHEVDVYEKIRDINLWSPKMRQPMVDIYGEEYFAKTWSAWIDGVKNIYEKQNGDICSKYLKDIKCPVLIMHGEKDPMIDSSHVSMLHINIKKSFIHLYPDGKHNIHLRYADDFNERTEKFLISSKL